MRGIVILPSAALVAACVACAPSNATTGGPAPTETVRLTGSGSMTADIHPTVVTRGGVVSAAPTRVWGVLHAVYDSLAIPVTTLDQANRVMGNPDHPVRRRLAGIPLSKYINCGSTLGSANTDSYEVRLSVLTQVSPDTSGGTTVLTTVQARGRPITISAEYSTCTSTGTLEARIVELVKAQLK